MCIKHKKSGLLNDVWLKTNSVYSMFWPYDKQFIYCCHNINTFWPLTNKITIFAWYRNMILVSIKIIYFIYQLNRVQ